MQRCKMVILGSAESRWTSSRKMSDRKCLLYSGNERRQSGVVGIFLNKVAVRALVSWKPVNHRIITACLLTRHAK